MIGSVPEYKDGLTQGFLLVEAVENVSLYGLQTAMETLGPKMAANQGRPATTKVPRKVEVYASHQAGMIFDLEARNVDLDKFLPDDFNSDDRYINSVQSTLPLMTSARGMQPDHPVQVCQKYLRR